MMRNLHAYSIDKSVFVSANRRKFGAKEYMTEFGLDELDYGARRLDPRLGHFTTPDPFATSNHSISPWAYCNGDPINFIDPTGKYTLVQDMGNGQYRVVGGSLKDEDANDLNIYVVDSDNVRTGETIGQTVGPRSFYNDNENSWAVGSTIDLLDISGIAFLTNIKKSHPNVIVYGLLARNTYFYDFKHTNGERYRKGDIPDYYRGMHVGVEKDGLPLIGSARDIGNIGAGYMTGLYGITWENTRKVFDEYQKHPEETCSVDAQLYGWKIGSKIWRQKHKDNYSKTSWYDYLITKFIK